MNSKPLVSIIIPVFNAEKSLYKSLESLNVQTYKSIQTIFINDGSTDRTLSILEKFKKLSVCAGSEVCIINHEFNQGVAQARNTGLKYSMGDYIYYMDADDHIEINTIELLVGEAIKTEADIIGCNWFLTFGANERKMKQPNFTCPSDAIQNIFNGSMRWNLWLFMVRKSLYVNNQIEFIPGNNMGEDLMVMIKLFACASRVSYLDCALYHYGQSNNQSLTKIYSEAHIEEVTANVSEVANYLALSDFSEQLQNNLDFLKLTIKLPLLISDQDEQFQKWIRWFPESNHRVLENKSLPFRTRFIQWLAVKEQFWAVKMYYKIVIRFVYGTLYK